MPKVAKTMQPSIKVQNNLRQQFGWASYGFRLS